MLAGKTYCPILHARVAEIKGLERLPEPTKELLFPLIVARPWPNANHLSKTWEKVADAFGARRYAVDLDPFKKHSNSDKPAAAEFTALFEPNDGYVSYFDAVEAIGPNAIPVLQLTNGFLPDLDRQIEHAARLDRGLVCRIQRDLCAQPTVLVPQVLAAFPDIVLFLDVGWSQDLLGHELWADRIIATFADGEPEAEIVVAGSSFPEAFRAKPRDTILAQERAVFDNLVRRYNSVVFTYGDWGSTRPPKDPTPMGSIPPRIDLPMAREWISFRSENAEGFEDVAQRVIEDDAWPSNLNIWGTYQIEGTAEGVPDGIKGQAASAAARINIHLHRQAHFGAAGTFGDQDEPYTD
jgi:hypothetical protein